jgi:ubiquitin-like protein Pup
MVAKRQHVKSPSPKESRSEPQGEAASRTDLIAELDDLLDEIDETLETNAEEFVRNYVQKGGQ